MFELWTLQSQKFTMPLLAEFTGERVDLKPAIGMRAREIKVVTSFIAGLGGQSEDDRWSMPAYTFKATAKQVTIPNTNAEELVRWSDDGKTLPGTGHVFALSPSQAEFVEAFWQAHTPHKSHDELIVLWTQFVNHALHWLVVRKKTLDLGFAVLEPVTYRANWKGILTRKFPNLGMRLKKGVPAGMEKALVNPGLMHFERNVIHWGLDVRLTKLWHKNMLTAERVRLKMLGPVAYAKFVLDYCQDSLWTTLGVLSGWTSQIARPCAKLRPGPDPGGQSFKASPAPNVESWDHLDIIPNRDLGQETLATADDVVFALPHF